MPLSDHEQRLLEEMERALQGQQGAEQALANSVQRGNVVLRNFERANRG